VRAALLFLLLLASAVRAGDLRFAPKGDIVWDFRARVGWSLDSRTRRGATEWKISGELHCLGEEPDGRIRLALVARAPEGCEIPSGVAIYLHDPKSGLSSRLVGEGVASHSAAVDAILRLDPVPCAGRALLAAPGSADETRKRDLFGFPLDFKVRIEHAAPDAEGISTLAVRLAEAIREPFGDPGRALVESEALYVLDGPKGDLVRCSRRELWREPDGAERSETVSVEILQRRPRYPKEAQALGDLPLLYQATACLPNVAWGALSDLRPFAGDRPPDHPWGVVAARLVDQALPGLLPRDERMLLGLVADERLVDLAGTPFDPESLEGGVSLLAFWAPGTLLDERLVRELGLRRGELRALGVRTVAFHCGVESDKVVRRFAEGHLADGEVILHGADLLSLLEVESLPAVLWIDRRGWIAHRSAGSGHGVEHEWFWIARRLLAEKE
jgi:hypothetical protein